MLHYLAFRAAVIVLAVLLGGCSLYVGNQIPAEISTSSLAPVVGETAVVVPQKEPVFQFVVTPIAANEPQSIVTCAFTVCKKMSDGTRVLANERLERKNLLYQAFFTLEKQVTWFTPVEGLSLMLTAKHGDIKETFRAGLEYELSEWTQFEVFAAYDGSSYAELTLRW